MNYEKQNWVDHIEDSETGEVFQEGTLFTAKRMNHIEEGIYQANFQTEDNTNELNKEQQTIKGILNRSVNYDIGNRDVIYYQAEIKNPLGIAYTNTPIALKVKFDKGECKSVNNIIIKNRDGVELPFQWEGETHPNYLLSDANLSTHSDGSLNGGTLWILDNLDVGATNLYTIEVHSQEFTHTFADKVTAEVDTSVADYPKDNLTANNITFQFDAPSGGHHLRRYIQRNSRDEINLGDPTNQIFKPFIRVETNDIDATGGNVTSTKKIEGNGAVYKDFIVENTFNDYNVKLKTIYRVFGNGVLDIKTICFVTDNEQLKRYGIKLRITSTEVPFTALQGGFYKTFSNGMSIMVKTYNAMLKKNIVTNDEYIVTNFTDVNDPILGLYWDSDIALEVPKGTCFDVKMRIDRIEDDNVSEENRIMNRLECHATKYTYSYLKKKYLGLCNQFTNHMHSFGFWKSTFIGLYWYEKFCYAKINGEHDAAMSAINNYITDMNIKYSNMTTEGFKSQYTPEKGIEYIGRDTSCLFLLLKEVESYKNNDTKLMYETIKNAIHNLADFYVWCEENSGGEGRINLKLYSGEALNGSATALKALNNSLKLEENITRRECYNRIKTRLEESILFTNIVPNGRGESLVDKAQIHYSNFTLFEYIDAVNFQPAFDTSVYINQTVTPSGKIREFGYNYNPGRFGFVHTSCYAAYVMYHYKTISSLQTACSIMENVLSNCYPSYYHAYPIDRYNKVQDTIDQSIEVQSAYQAIMELIYS